MSVGVLSFVKLKERGVSVRFYFSFFPSGGVRVLFACLSSRSGQARPARHEAAPAAHHSCLNRFFSSSFLLLFFSSFSSLVLVRQDRFLLEDL